MPENFAEEAVQSVAESVGRAKEVNDGLAEKWLTFRLDKQLFGISVIMVEQIIRMMPITEVPYYPAYAKGIINLRGMVIPIVDLRILLEMANVQNTAQTCIIIVSLDNSQVGFVVDGVDAVIDIPDNAICEPPVIDGNSGSRYLTGVATVDNGAEEDSNILLMDMTKILRKDEFDMLAPSDA